MTAGKPGMAPPNWSATDAVNCCWLGVAAELSGTATLPGWMATEVGGWATVTVTARGAEIRPPASIATTWSV